MAGVLYRRCDLRGDGMAVSRLAGPSAVGVHRVFSDRLVHRDVQRHAVSAVAAKAKDLTSR